MSGFLMDTNVISELVREKPDPNVVRWVGGVDESRLFLSVLTLGEIRKGIERLPAGRRRDRLETWLRVGLRGRFQGRILPVDDPIAERWGSVSGIAARKGRPLPVIDALLAATALEHGLALATRNCGAMDGTGVETINPWVAVVGSHRR